MNIKQMAFLVTLFGLLLFVAGCEDFYKALSEKKYTIYHQSQKIPIDAPFLTNEIGVAIADINGDGHTDIISLTARGVEFFENMGNDTFNARGIIVSTIDEISNSEGVGITVGDINSDGILDIIIATPKYIRIIKNPVLHK